ncbi:MAG: class I SAM-dependent DNA methyltransferase [Bacteroidaceae bacterium]|nr:class I SAM-dependent DNA methyltransferase [Bacteroidaceae bacterium]
MNPETRHEGGMYYTSVENIHKVIEPLFLKKLTEELDEILNVKNNKIRNDKLTLYQQKLASLTFLDPACGSGNFLTETYLSLRRLENIAINVRLGDYNTQLHLQNMAQAILVSPSQFYGIEINDFAVEVARTALWISEAQMFQETARILGQHDDFLPLKSNLNIIQDDALYANWSHIVGKRKLNYIIGNPPFAGYSEQTKMQKESLKHVLVKANGKPIRAAGKVDFVSGWYFKACEMMHGTSIRAALVSTNSVTQGEQVAYIWQPLKERYNIRFDFAYRTFRWDSEVKNKRKGIRKVKGNAKRKTAQVHCVIIGFSLCKKSPANPVIYCADGSKISSKHINPYLLDKEDAFILPKTKPLCEVPYMLYGNKPADGNGFILSEKEREEALTNESSLEKYIRPLLGAKEFLQGERRYCLWLVGADPNDLYHSPFIKRRLKQVKDFRSNSKKAATNNCDSSPLFQEIRQPNCNYLLVPRHSSENRIYVPMGFINPQYIATDAVQMVPNASLYEFGVMQSRVHMAWLKAVCGRLEMRYRYSKDLVYNNFPWPTSSEETRESISDTARAILDARNIHPGSSLAAMYSPMCMHQELREAHERNDIAVMKAYGFNLSLSDDEIFDRLFAMYQQLLPKKKRKKASKPSTLKKHRQQKSNEI